MNWLAAAVGDYAASLLLDYSSALSSNAPLGESGSWFESAVPLLACAFPSYVKNGEPSCFSFLKSTVSALRVGNKALRLRTILIPLVVGINLMFSTI